MNPLNTDTTDPTLQLDPPPSPPRTPLQTLRAIIPWWYLLVFALWAYIGFIYLLAPDATIFQGEIGSFMLAMLLLVTIAVLAIGFTGNYIRLKVGRPLPPPKFYFHPLRFALLIGLPVTALIAYTIYSTPPTYSQPSSFHDQLALANWLASIVDKDALLTEIRAEEMCCRRPSTSPDVTLEVKFDYLRQSNKTMRITLYDTSPPRIKELETDTYGFTNPEPARQNSKLLTDFINSIQISPRQVLRTSLSDPSAPPFLPEGSFPSIRLYPPAPPIQSDPVDPSNTWSILYYAQPQPDTPGHISSITGQPLRLVILHIDPTTGQITKIHDEDF